MSHEDLFDGVGGCAGVDFDDSDMGDTDNSIDLVGAFENDSDQIGGIFGKLYRAVKKTVKGSLLKKLAIGSAVMFPVAGLSVAGGLALADRVIAVHEGHAGKKAKKQLAKALANTKKLAAKGDPQAKRTLTLITEGAKLQKALRAAGPHVRGVLATHDGRLMRGTWQRV